MTETNVCDVGLVVLFVFLGIVLWRWARSYSGSEDNGGMGW